MRKIEIILKALNPLPARVYSIFARKFIFLFLDQQKGKHDESRKKGDKS
jgi:hypothetical protein